MNPYGPSDRARHRRMKHISRRLVPILEEMTGGMDVVYGGALKTANARMLASVPVMDGGLIALPGSRGRLDSIPRISNRCTYLERTEYWNETQFTKITEDYHREVII